MLTRAEFDDLPRLLAKAMSGALDMQSDQRLRWLLSRQSPEVAVMRIPDLIRFGHFVVGLYALQHGIQPPARASA